MDPTCRLCLFAKRSSPHIFQFGPDGHYPFRDTDSILGLFPYLTITKCFEHLREKRGTEGERNREGVSLFYATRSKESIQNNAAGTISGLARINEKAPTDRWIVHCHLVFCLCGCPTQQPKHATIESKREGPEPEPVKFSLFSCLSHPFLTFSGRPFA